MTDKEKQIDYFAGQALTGILAGRDPELLLSEYTQAEIAQLSFAFAAAMIEEKRKLGLTAGEALREALDDSVPD